MTEEAEDAFQPTETERVEAWRAETLLELGVDPDTAFRFAADPNVDIHRFVRLVHDGCDIETARRILEP